MTKLLGDTLEKAVRLDLERSVETATSFQQPDLYPYKKWILIRLFELT